MNFGPDQRDPDLNLNVFQEDHDNYSCEYVSVDSFKGMKNGFHAHGFSIINFNIRSFNKNSTEFLAYLDSTEHIFDIIILSETWINESTLVLSNIPGYCSVHSYRSNMVSGGISIFIRESIKFETIDGLVLSNNIIESVAITINYPNSQNKLNILGIYRPQGNIKLFTDTLQELITQHSLSRDDSVIAGDFNIDLLTEVRSEDTKYFMNSMNTKFYRPVITRPTRIDNRHDSATIIDHVWVNTPDFPVSCILFCDITDHFPVFCRINVPYAHDKELVKITFRDMSERNKTLFQQMIWSTNWNDILAGANDANELETS